MTVKRLKNSLKGVPDNIEICLSLHGNQHDCREVGLSISNDDGLYEFINNVKYNDSDDINFLIEG